MSGVETMVSRVRSGSTRATRERGGKQASCPRRGSAVIMADESKNRNTWKLGSIGFHQRQR